MTTMSSPRPRWCVFTRNTHLLWKHRNRTVISLITPSKQALDLKEKAARSLLIAFQLVTNHFAGRILNKNIHLVFPFLHVMPITFLTTTRTINFPCNTTSLVWRLLYQIRLSKTHLLLNSSKWRIEKGKVNGKKWCRMLLRRKKKHPGGHIYVNKTLEYKYKDLLRQVNTQAKVCESGVCVQTAKQGGSQIYNYTLVGVELITKGWGNQRRKKERKGDK